MSTTNYSRHSFLPYGRQYIDEEDIETVAEVLRSNWITTGPKVEMFEKAIADFVNSQAAVAVSSGTAALHAAVYAVGIGSGDEVIVTPMTFAATANCIVYQGGTPVFADVNPDTLLIDPVEVEKKITPQTKAIIAVDYAGQPCDYDRLRSIADKHGLKLIADACHSLGAAYKGRKVGALADLTVFSFHPVKHITTGEGGMITTNDLELAEKMRSFRNHGITTDHHQRESQGLWFYEMTDLGFNYRLTDLQCALGLSQLKKLPKWLNRRRKIAAIYDQAFYNMHGIKPLGLRSDVMPAKQSTGIHISDLSAVSQTLEPPASLHAHHLYVVRLESKKIEKSRDQIFAGLRGAGIGVNVHYIPVHLHSYYKTKFKTGPGLCPVAESACQNILSLPMFPAMSDQDIGFVVCKVRESLESNHPYTWHSAGICNPFSQNLRGDR